MTVAFAVREAWDARASALGARLALDQPVAREVLVNLANDPNEAVNLWIARSNPEAFNSLLERLSRLPPLPELDEDTWLARVDETLDDLESVAAITADDATVMRREQACLACPKLKGTPQQLRELFANIDTTAAPGQKVQPLTCRA